MPTKDAAASLPSRYPGWVRIPAWISAITAIVSIVLLALAIVWPLFVRGADTAFLWIGVLAAYGVMILAWIVWALLLLFTRRR